MKETIQRLLGYPMTSWTPPNVVKCRPPWVGCMVSTSWDFEKHQILREFWCHRCLTFKDIEGESARPHGFYTQWDYRISYQYVCVYIYIYMYIIDRSYPPKWWVAFLSPQLPTIKSRIFREQILGNTRWSKPITIYSPQHRNERRPAACKSRCCTRPAVSRKWPIQIISTSHSEHLFGNHRI